MSATPLRGRGRGRGRGGRGASRQPTVVIDDKVTNQLLAKLKSASMAREPTADNIAQQTRKLAMQQSKMIAKASNNIKSMRETTRSESVKYYKQDVAAMLSASRSESNMPPYLAIAAAFKSPQNVILHSYALGAEVRGSTTLTYCTVTMSVPVQTLFVNQHYGQRYASASNPPPEAALLRIQGQQSIRMPAAHGRLIVDYAAYQKKAIAASGDYPPLVDVIANPTLIETMPGSTASRLTTAPETLDFKFSSASFPPMESKAVTELRSIFKSRYGSKTIVAVANDGITTKTGKPSEFSASSYIDYIAFFVQDDMTDNAILRYNTMSWYIANGSGGSFTFQNIVSGARVDDAALIQSLTNRWKTLSTVASSSG